MKKNLQDVMNEALQFHQQGQLDQAEKRYMLVLEHAPDFAPALHYLGVIGLQTNHAEGAIPLLRRASQIMPDDPAILTNYGIALLQTEKFEDAVKALSKAAKLAPKNAQILANLGNAQKEILQHEQAIQSYESALSQDKNLTDVARNLAICYGALFNYEKALSTIQYAAKLAPESVEVRITLANILLKTDQPIDAIEIYKSLLPIVQDSSLIKANLALAYAATNQLTNAKETARNVISEFPDFLDGWLNYISILQEQGQFEEAEDIARKALQQFPENISLLCLIARGKKFTDPKDPDVAQMLSRAKSPNVTPGDSIKLNFALGKVFESVADYDTAFKHYNEANTLARKQVDYRVEHDLASMKNIQNKFNRQTLNTLRNLAPQSHLPHDFKPIFLVGMPRSGSTLSEQILASHPQVSGAGELPFLARKIAETVGLENSMDCTSHIDRISADTIKDLRQQYYEYIQRLNLETPCFTDKMLMNFLHIGLITVLFPNAPIIHCTREPLDSCLSIFKLDFSRNGHHYASDQEDLARFYTGYQDLMAHWNQLIPTEIHEVNYESLIAGQQQQTEILLEFCGLPWHDNCLKYYETNRRVSTLSVAQVRKPIYSSSVNKYEHYLEHITPMVKHFSH